MSKATDILLEDIDDLDLLEKRKRPPKMHPELKPGEKMVFGKVVNIGVTPQPKKAAKSRAKKSAKEKYKTKSSGKRKNMRKRVGPNKHIGKAFSRETDRQIDHSASRGVKKKKGIKESMMALIEKRPGRDTVIDAAPGLPSTKKPKTVKVKDRKGYKPARKRSGRAKTDTKVMPF